MPDPSPPRPQLAAAALRAFVGASTAVADRVLLDDHTWDDLDMDAVAEPATLCLIDELLSGTGSAEQLAPSAAILEHLGRAGDDVRFDHRIRAGLASRRNAIRLLERRGYPSELVASARGRLCH